MQQPSVDMGRYSVPFTAAETIPAGGLYSMASFVKWLRKNSEIVLKPLFL